MCRSITDALKNEGLVGMRGRGKFNRNHGRAFANFEIIAAYSNGKGIVTRLVFYNSGFQTREDGYLECPLDSIRNHQYKGKVNPE